MLELGVGEPTISQHIAGYIREAIPKSLSVDVEYNRHGTGAKILQLPPKDGSNQLIESTVRPDVVVHKRGDDEQNILVIELKKPGRDLSRDRVKLEAFRKQYQYQNAAHVIVGKRGSMTIGEVRWVDG